MSDHDDLGELPADIDTNKDPRDLLKTEPRKKILRRTTNDGGGADGKPHTRWDEDNLAENAEYMASHRPMKIDEPPTPYNRAYSPSRDSIGSGSGDEAAAAAAAGSPAAAASAATAGGLDKLNAALFDTGRVRSGSVDSTSSAGSLHRRQVYPDDEADDPEAHEANFKAKRAAHYNEFQRVKEAMAKGELDEDEGEDAA